MSSELNELRISSARLESDARDATITLDIFKDRVVELQRDIDDQKINIQQLKTVQIKEKEEEKQKRKQEMLNEMLSKIDLVRNIVQLSKCSDLSRRDHRESIQLPSDSESSLHSSTERRVLKWGRSFVHTSPRAKT